MTGSLAEALGYRNADVVHKFVDHFRIPEDEGASIFDEVKKWLWLNSLEDAPLLYVTAEIQIIDEMWHTFVLFTKDYAAYCESRFGRYIHHKPTSRREELAEREEREADPDGYDRRWRESMGRQYRFIADRLDNATLVRWYAEYPLRYGREFFARFAIDVPDPGPEAAARMRNLIEKVDRRPEARG